MILFRFLAASILILVSLSCFSREVLPLSELLAQLRSQGIVINYSSNLLDDQQKLELLPEHGSKLEQLRHWLHSHELIIRQVATNHYLVAPKPHPQMETLEGTITNALSGAAIRGAVIQLTSDELPEHTDTTDSRGHFHISATGLTSETITRARIRIEAPGFDVLEQPVTRPPLTLALMPQMESVEVTVSRYRIFRHGINHSFLADAESLSATPAIGDDKLRMITHLPGTAADGISAQPRIRGGRKDELLVLFDGVELLDPYHFRDFQNLFNVVDSSVLESATFHTGGFQVDFGNRLSGVMDLRTREPDSEGWQRVSASLFNVGYAFAESNDTGNTHWLGWARRSTIAWSMKALKNEYGDPRTTDAYLKLSHRINDDWRIKGSLLYFNDTITLNDTEKVEGASSSYDNLYAWLDLEKKWSENLQSNTRLIWTDIEHLREGSVLRGGLGTANVRDRREFSRFNLDHTLYWDGGNDYQLELGLGGSSGKAAYDLRQSTLYADEYADDNSTYLYALLVDTLPPPVRDISVRPDVNQAYLFVKDRVPLGERWIAEWGLRWDWQDYQNQFSDGQWSARGNLLYQFNENTTFRFALSRYTQAQELHELPVEDGVEAFYEAKTALQTVVGIGYQPSPALHFKGEFYYKLLENQHPYYYNEFNYLEPLPEVLPDRKRLEADEGYTHGMEFSLEHQLSSGFTWWVNYSRSVAMDRVQGTDQLRDGDQTDTVNLGLRGTWRTWNYQLQYTYHTGWPRKNFYLTTSGSEQQLVVDSHYRSRLRHYTRLDLHLARTISLHDSSLEFFFDITNLLNQTNELGRSYEFKRDSEGYIQLKTKPEEGLGITPNIGIIWEF